MLRRTGRLLCGRLCRRRGLFELLQEEERGSNQYRNYKKCQKWFLGTAAGRRFTPVYRLASFCHNYLHPITDITVGSLAEPAGFNVR